MALMIRPSNIDTSKHFWELFGKSETEVSARWIVRFCQERNDDSWAPFSMGDLLDFYQAERLVSLQADWDRVKARNDYGDENVPLCYQGHRPESCGESFCFNGLGDKLLTVSGYAFNRDTVVTISPEFIKTCFSKFAKDLEFPGLV